MKITKLGHSCVLVETADRVGLFDPGVWSKIDFDKLPQIDRLAITHEHQDHFDISAIKKIVEHSPGVHIVANDSITEKLKAAGVEVVYRGTQTDCMRPFEAPHEQLPVLNKQVPENNGYHFKDVFTHPGDSHSFTVSKQVLALPVIAPWGSTVDAVKLALKLKPQYVVPIHDVQYKREAREWLYDLLEEAFEGSGIEVICKSNGDTIEL